MNSARGSPPHATGFIPTAFFPCATSAASRPHATTVLQPAVSDPVTKTPRRLAVDVTLSPALRLDVDDWMTGVAHARQRFPGVAIDHLKGCGKLAVAPKGFITTHEPI